MYNSTENHVLSMLDCLDVTLLSLLTDNFNYLAMLIDSAPDSMLADLGDVKYLGLYMGVYFQFDSREKIIIVGLTALVLMSLTSLVEVRRSNNEQQSLLTKSLDHLKIATFSTRSQ